MVTTKITIRLWLLQYLLLLTFLLFSCRYCNREENELLCGKDSKRVQRELWPLFWRLGGEL